MGIASKKTILLDGALGTGLWELTADKQPVWVYNLEAPDKVLTLLRRFIEAGSQIIFANTFGANRLAVEKTAYRVSDVIKAAMKLAFQAVEGTDVKVAFDAGPLTQLMEPYGDLEEEDVAEIYDEMLSAAMSCDRKPDYIIFETFLDVEMMRVAVETAKKYDVPVICSMTFGEVGKTMFGNSVEDVIEALEPLGIEAIGLNCSLGPAQCLPIIREFAAKTTLPLFFKPNAGSPSIGSDGQTEHPYTAEQFADEVAEALDAVTYVGGCCGCGPDFISALRAKL